MRKSKAQKFEKLECLRGFAAIYVVLHHNIKFSYDLLGIDLGELFRFGQEAVILFFLISGFVIYYSFSQKPDLKFWDYFKKRFLRIYIPLVLVFLIGYLLQSVAASQFLGINFKDLILNLAMLQDWAFARPNIIVEPFLGNTPLWSLAYEWWFYMLFFPIMLLIKHAKVNSLHVFAVSIVATIFYCFYPYFLPRILSYFCIWWVGVQLASNYIEGKKLTVANCVVSIVSLAVICLLYLIASIFKLKAGVSFSLGTHPFIELRHFGFALFVLCASIFWSKYQWRFFEVIFRPFLVFAPVSYVVYISHYHLVTSATYLSGINNRILELLLYIIVMLFSAWVIELKIYPYALTVLKRRRISNQV